MLRILYIASTLQGSGPTNQLYNIVKYLDRSVFEPCLVTLSQEPRDSRWIDFDKLGVMLDSLKMSRIQSLFMAISRLKKKIRRINPDLIHTQGIRADVLASCLSFLFPKVATVRNFLQLDYPMTYGPLLGRLMAWRHVDALRRLNICVGVSAAVCENLQQTFGITNTTFIQNGVDTEFFQPVSVPEKIIIREKLKLPLEGRIWISAGHLSDRKDPLFIIHAWQKHFGRDVDDQLVFLGNGPLYKTCIEACDNYPNIHIAGRVTNVPNYLQAADFFISASKAEGLPNTVLEALACGLPVILSHIEPHREIWKMSSGIGFLFDLGIENGFIAAVQKILGEEHKKMSNASLSLVGNHLSAEVMSKNYQELYEDLIGKNS